MKTKMIKKTPLAAMLAVTTTFCGYSSLNAQTIYSNGFDTGPDNLGNPIALVSGSDSGSPGGGLYQVDTLSSAAGYSTRSMRIMNRSENAAPIVEWEFGAVSAAKVSIEYNVNGIFPDAAGDTGAGLIFAVGQATGSSGPEFSTFRNRLVDAQFQNDGVLSVRARGNGYTDHAFTTGTIGTFTAFINASGAAFDYTAPGATVTSTLADRSIAFYNGSTLLDTQSFSGTAELNDDPISGIANPIGRLGISGLSSQAGVIGNYDNFTVEAIPEPSTYAVLFGLVALGSAVIRRRFRWG